MSQKSIAAVIIILAVIGLAVLGYFKATSSQGAARIEITPKSFDFGQAEYGQVLDYTFKIKNLGKEILEIKRVATSCACTTAKVAKEKINPGETADLLVTYDTAAMGSGSHGKGEQERIIYVKSNDPINPQVEVMIYANVR